MKNIFYKYNCSDNTFIAVKYNEDIDYQVFSKNICSKISGIGADGLLVIKDNINEVLFFNQDGTKASFCGNGLRGAIHFLKDQKGFVKRKIPILFNDEIYYGKVISEEPFCSEISLDKSNHINLKIPSKFNDFKEKVTLPNIIEFNKMSLAIYPIKVGVFHIVIFNNTNLKNNEYLTEQSLNQLKEILKEYYLDEPNIDLVKFDYEKKMIEEVTFYERGVGYTSTCGSGSIAIAVILELMNLLNEGFLKINDELYVVVKEDAVKLIGKSRLVCWGKYLC